MPRFGALPDPTAPMSFPDNYPDEGFYTLTNANLTTGNGGKALLVVALEQAFGAGPVADGDQVTFARLRLKITNATDGVNYKFTTPAGVKTLQTSKPGLVFDTEDIGIGGKGDFTGALGGRVGPFLTWDTFPTDSALKPDRPERTPMSVTARPRTRSTEAPTVPTSSVLRARHQPQPDGRRLPNGQRTDRGLHRNRLFTVQGKLRRPAA